MQRHRRIVGQRDSGKRDMDLLACEAFEQRGVQRRADALATARVMHRDADLDRLAERSRSR
jgi:hypothetical protein